MTRFRGLIIIVTLSGLFWLTVGYRVVAWQTGKLGPVSLTISRLDEVNRYVEWSPSADQYEFTSRQTLLIPANTAALFLIDPPPRFQQGTVTVIASSPINLTAEYRHVAQTPSNMASSRTWRWSELSRFPGGHRLHLNNPNNHQVEVQQLKLTFIP